MGNIIPSEVKALHEARAIPSQTAVVISATATDLTAPSRSLYLNNGQTYNQENIIGFFVRVNTSGSSTKYSSLKNPLVTTDSLDKMHLTVMNGNAKILDAYPLSEAVPNGQRLYVPVWWEKFNNSGSYITIDGATAGATAADIEIILVHKDSI